MSGRDHEARQAGQEPKRGRPARESRPMPAIAVAIAIVLVIAGVLMAIYIDRYNTEQKNDEVNVQAHILASTVTAALQFGDQVADPGIRQCAAHQSGDPGRRRCMTSRPAVCQR